MLRPYVSTIRSNTFGTIKENVVDKAIKQKVAELKPFLQDDDVIDNLEEVDNEKDLTLDGKDETTIIEFVPPKYKDRTAVRDGKSKKKNNTLKANVEKYKRIREKIKLALINEKVSTKTFNFITKTLDDMIAKIIENRCTWKSTTHNMDALQARNRVDRTISIANEWNERWASLKQDYIEYKRDKPTETFPGAKLFVFFEQFHDFLAHIVKDIEAMEGHYKVVCQFVERKKPLQIQESKDNLRVKSVIVDKTVEAKKKHKCKNFKICSKELSKFMTNFYNTLNETAVSTLRNYASMYVRDVNTDDSKEKESVVTVLNNISDLAEYKLSKIFRKETKHFQLDPNKDKDENFRLLREYLKKTILTTKNYIKESLDTGLQSLRIRLLVTVKQDISVNLDVDLNNMERDLKNGICSSFSLCNGKYANRRNDGGQYVNLEKNSIYVKVQLSMDEALKERLTGTTGAKRLLNSNKKNQKNSTTKKKQLNPHDYPHQYRPNKITSMKEKSTKKIKYKITKARKQFSISNWNTYLIPNVTRTSLGTFITTTVLPTEKETKNSTTVSVSSIKPIIK